MSTAFYIWESVLLSLILPPKRSFLMNATKPRMPHLQRWARQYSICKTNCHGLEWCMPVPRVGWQHDWNNTYNAIVYLTCYFFYLIFAPRCLWAKEHDLHEPSGNLGWRHTLQSLWWLPPCNREEVCTFMLQSIVYLETSQSFNPQMAMFTGMYLLISWWKYLVRPWSNYVESF